MDVVYQDFYNLGRIFQVEDKAEEIVSGMKGKITAAEEAVAGQEATPVFVFDMAQEEGAYTCGQQLHLQAHRARGRRQHLQRCWTPPGPP